MVLMDDRRWARTLYNLRRTLWPGGKLYVSQSVERTSEEREALLKNAAASVKQFLPSKNAKLIVTKCHNASQVTSLWHFSVCRCTAIHHWQP